LAAKGVTPMTVLQLSAVVRARDKEQTASG
jgi:hypothetical protein